MRRDSEIDKKELTSLPPLLYLANISASASREPSQQATTAHHNPSSDPHATSRV